MVIISLSNMINNQLGKSNYPRGTLTIKKHLLEMDKIVVIHSHWSILQGLFLVELTGSYAWILYLPCNDMKQKRKRTSE
jgi:hypothetical protein